VDLARDFKTNARNRFGASIKAFHDVDERQRMAMRQALESGLWVSAIANSLSYQKKRWSAVKNDRSIGEVSDERFWRHGMLTFYGLAVDEITVSFYHNNSPGSQLGLVRNFRESCAINTYDTSTMGQSFS